MAIYRNARWFKQFPVVNGSTSTPVAYETGMTFACELRTKPGQPVLLSMTTANGRLSPIDSEGDLLLQFDVARSDWDGVPQGDYTTDIIRTDTTEPTRYCSVVLYVRDGVTLS